MKLSKKYSIGLSLGVILMMCFWVGDLSRTVEARDVVVDTSDEPRESYKSLRTILPVTIIVPTVVELPVLGTEKRGEFAVYEMPRGAFVPYLLTESYIKNPVYVSSYSENASSGDDTALVDGDPLTSIEFYFTETTRNSAIITLTATEAVESSSIVIGLDRYVALPTRVGISASEKGSAEKVVLASRKPDSSTITFPKTRADQWIITLEYAQPLRMNELHLVQDDVERTVRKNLRFLAQPQSTYTIYSDPDRFVSISTIEQGNLSDNTNVRVLPSAPMGQNVLYRKADMDGDGIVDINDNCVQVANSDQLDIDGNGRGDMCDDYDRDGRIQEKDNCPTQTNASQEDTDGDGMGDVCDPEESRITEKYPWVPWAGMGVAVLVLGVLFILVGMTPKNEDAPLV